MQRRRFAHYSIVKGLISHSPQNLPEKRSERSLFKNSSAERQTVNISLVFAEAKSESSSLGSGVVERGAG